MLSYQRSRFQPPRLVTAARLLTGALVAGALAACVDSLPTAPTRGAAPGAPAASKAEMNAGLATLRRVTARYQRVAAAEEDGFGQFLPECVEGLGFVYANPARVSDGTLDLEEPEVLFYEPQKNGRLRLIGIEMAIPIEDFGTDPPSLFGHEFHTNEDLGLYGIHIWVWRHNPNGVFAFMHPDASCEFAG